MRLGAEELPYAGMPGDGIGDEPPTRQLGHQVMEIGESQEQVDLGDLLLQLRLVPLHQATDRHDRFDRRRSLQLRGREHRVDGLLLGRVDEPAGVHQDHVGVREMRRYLGTVAHELADEPLGIDRRLVAPQRDHAEFHPR